MNPTRRIYPLSPSQFSAETIAVTFAKTSRSPEPFDVIAAELGMTKRNGGNVKLYDMAENNKVMPLHFWEIRCGPCRREIPDLIALHNQFKDKGV